jgi:hypothetical protein
LDDLGKTFLSARAMARLARDTMNGVGRATERIRRDSIRPPNTAAEVIVNHDNQEAQESRAATQTEPVQPPLPLPPGAGPQASADQYDQFGAVPYNEYSGDAEIFGNLDPNFDLGRADAIFSANLDLSTPYFADDWPVSGLYTGDVG